MNAIPENREHEKFWNQLIGIVAKGGVAPVVGEDLLRLPGEHGQQTLYEALAARYALSCDISVDPTEQTNLSAVVTHHPKFFRHPYDVYSGVGEEYSAWNPPIPESLRALARIRHFNLFVSTTFDDLLERALNEERFAGKKRTEVIAYSPKNIPDDKQISNQLASGHPVVVQLFGNCRDPLEYALTEGDKVEYMHALQTADYRPARIFSELYNRPLLMLGNRFPDWLTRIFLRMVRKTSLNDNGVPQYVSDARVVEDALMKFFLNNFATNTKLVEDLDPVQLVMELSRRWLERFGAHQIYPVAIGSDSRPMPKNAIFLSYCATDSSGHPSRDAHIAIALRDALEALGVDVWFDKDQLQGGDEFERRIQRYINTCSLFMPLISETTESRNDGFFRKEWNWALAKLPEFTGSDRQFLFPIFIDELNPYQAKVPDEFKRFQFTTMLGPTPNPQLLGRIQSLYRRARGEI